MNLLFHHVEFVLSVHGLNQLPEDGVKPEFAFAGRSNVGKSSLLNTITGRKSLVKVSGRPGKTQGLNFFETEQCYLVDLPGYGFARVSKGMQDKWQDLISIYLKTRKALCCVVLLCDIRHGMKAMDLQLIEWLRYNGINFILVYTKSDKLSGNKRNRHAAALDAGFGVKKEERVIFSSKTGMGRDRLLTRMGSFVRPDLRFPSDDCSE